MILYLMQGVRIEMSIEYMRSHLDKGENSINPKDIPGEIVASVQNWSTKMDLKNKECLFVQFVTKEGKTFVQKYSPMHYKELSTALENMGLKSVEDLRAKWIFYKAKNFRLGFPRLLPVDFEQTELPKTQGDETRETKKRRV